MSKAKAMTSEKINEPKKVKKPIVIETISSTLEHLSEKKEINPVAQKKVYLTKVPIPEGFIRAIVLIDYVGMSEVLYEGDVQDLPDRRFKTLSNRGLVKQYDGDRPPNKLR